MEFKQFYVEGLFGLYNHTIDFLESRTPEKRASIVMLYGKNGIGKTTVLRMIDGLMRLDFTVFREISFRKAYLKFTHSTIVVQGNFNLAGGLEYLDVEYYGNKVKLHPKEPGPLNVEENYNQEKVRKKYREDLKGFLFEFIDTERLLKRTIKENMIFYDRNLMLERNYRGKLLREGEGKEKSYLADKVKLFITESQIDTGRYFSKDEPELFEKILASIETPSKNDVIELRRRIVAIDKLEKEYEIKRLGISRERWDKKKLRAILDIEEKKKEPSIHKLTVISSFLEVLESRYNDKLSLATRLLIFEELINGFLLDKKIQVSRDKGFVIKSSKDKDILENQLSTGEYHLLYLTVLALCTTVVGTVIAIDEPEMSMHISWQNKLVGALLKISSKANPQFLFATHSPDIAANYSNSLRTNAYG